MQSPKKDLAEAITKVVLTFIFLGGILIFLITGQSSGSGMMNFRLDWLDLLLLSLATYRLGRLIAFDRVAEPLRAPFARTVRDVTGAGSTVIARGSGAQRAFGQLISCPICAGTWIAAGLVILLYFFPAEARLFLFMAAAVGGAELIHNATEALCWSGMLNRARAGEMLQNNQQKED
ncbi:MAG: DUF1360 domain-containing protein [Bellilinea sp.]|jgi:hypothetical protein